MPRYYLHLFNDIDVIDEEGIELPGEAAALEHALRNARVMAADSVCNGRLVLSHRIDVTCDDGRMIGTVYFRDAVSVEG